MKTWSVSGDLYWDETDAGQLSLTIGSSVTVNLFPEGGAATATYYSGGGIVTKFDISAAFDGMVEGSISIEGNGALSTVTV
jgi:predicted secreted protein